MNTTRRSFMSRAAGIGAVASITAFSSAILIGGPAQAANHERREERRYPRVHAALEALREARAELSTAPDDFHGHKETVMHTIDDAIHQLEVLVEDVSHK